MLTVKICVFHLKMIIKLFTTIGYYYYHTCNILYHVNKMDNLSYPSYIDIFYVKFLPTRNQSDIFTIMVARPSDNFLVSQWATLLRNICVYYNRTPLRIVFPKKMIYQAFKFSTNIPPDKQSTDTPTNLPFS